MGNVGMYIFYVLYFILIPRFFFGTLAVVLDA